METTTLTLRIPAEMKEQLAKLADATHRSKSYLAGEAIRQYLELEVWQIKEAGANDFASDDEIDALMRKYAG